MKHDRIWNFYAGPAAVPLEALEKIHQSWFNYNGEGMAVMEMSHRSKPYDEIHNNTAGLVKKLLGLGDNYHVLFLQGGASLQFAMVPLNFLGNDKEADYIHTGTWSAKAIKEAKLFGNVNVAFDGNDTQFLRLPRQNEVKLTEGAEYVHITSNNTIRGTQFFAFPETNGVPLVADMSSDILSRCFDPEPFGLIYAGAQKNLGPSGVTLVILRNDFYERCIEKNLTTMLHYKTHVEKNSLHNTPNSFGIYFMECVLQWIDDMGGLKAMEAHNREKADLLYGFINNNDGFYCCHIEKDSRSWMNVCFHLPTEALDQEFVRQGAENGFIGLKGYRSAGGCRVSMYNATPPEAIRDLVDFMQDFMDKNG